MGRYNCDNDNTRGGGAVGGLASCVIKLSRYELKLDFPQFRTLSVILMVTAKETPKVHRH